MQGYANIISIFIDFSLSICIVDVLQIRKSPQLFADAAPSSVKLLGAASLGRHEYVDLSARRKWRPGDDNSSVGLHGR
jgi:hypothetical protein